MRGRKPTPTVLNELHGKPSNSRKPNPHEPKAVTGDLLDAPDWMSDSQKAGWKYAMDHAPPGLLKRIDQGALTVWVCAEDLHRQASIAQARIGSLLLKEPNAPLNTAQQSPYIPLMSRQGLIMVKVGAELGFSPVSRPRVGVMPSLPMPTAKGADAQVQRRPLENFLAARPATSEAIN